MRSRFEAPRKQIASAYEAKQVTYAALQETCNEIGTRNCGHYLTQTYTVSPDDLIGIQQERSEWLVISLLAVLKSGGAYVPIDPAYPQDRIDYIIADSQCKVVLDEKELDRFRANAEKYSRDNPSSGN